MTSRDDLGRIVREAWVRWARTQPNPKPSWLTPYDELNEPDKEADRQIGEAVARWTLIGDSATMTSEEIEAFRKGQKVFVSEMYHAAIDAVCDAALRSKSERNEESCWEKYQRLGSDSLALEAIVYDERAEAWNAAWAAASAIAAGLAIANEMSGRDSVDAKWIRDELRAKVTIRRNT